MRRRKKSYALRHFHIWTQLKNKNHTPFFPGRHTTTRQLAYLRHAIFPSPANRHIASHTNIMNQLQYREVAKNTSIRTRFKSLTSIEQAKLRILKKCSMMLFDKLMHNKNFLFTCFLLTGSFSLLYLPNSIIEHFLKIRSLACSIEVKLLNLVRILVFLATSLY